MGLFGFGKKKEKTLEELAIDFGITLVNGSPDGVYEKLPVKGADQSEEVAKKRLLENAKLSGARIVSSTLSYSYHESLGKRLCIVSSFAYRLKAS